jgi:hypothetical protein
VSWVQGITLAVSVAAVVATVGIGLLRFRHERRLADRDDARKTLAAAAREFGTIKSTMRDALTAFDQPLATGEHWPADTMQTIRKLETAAETAEAERDAARIRFKPESDMVDALERATKALRSTISVYYLGHKARGPKGAAARERKGEGQEAWTLSLDFDKARDDFLAAAQAVVGMDDKT